MTAWAGILIAAWVGVEDPEAPLAVGTPAPAWRNLPNVDGQKHSLDDCKGAKVVVVVFTCNSCPYAVAYEDRLIAFTKTYADKGVKVVAINVNRDGEDGPEHMKSRAKEKGFPFPYLFDESQKIGRDYGALVTPHVFILDEARHIAYEGAFDDSRRPDRVSKRYAIEATEALLAGKRPSPAQTRATGCRIRYD